MTYRLARSQLVEILESVDGLREIGLWGENFREARASDETALPASREFFIRSTSREVKREGYIQGAARFLSDVEVSIFYPYDVGEPANLDEILTDDWEKLNRDVLDIAQWGRPTSSVIGISTTPVPFAGSEDIEITNEEGLPVGVFQVTRYTIEHNQAFEPAPPPPQPDFDVTAFVIAAAATLEIGATLATPSFTAAYNRPPTSATLTDNDANPPQDVTGTPTAFASVNSYVKTAPNASVTWTLTADDGGDPDSSQEAVAWRPGVFTGVITGAGPYSEAEIEALSLKGLRSSAALSTTVFNPATQYIVHAYPATYGPKTALDFQIGDFGPGDMAEIQTALSITNPEGVTLDYRVARSDYQVNAPGGINFTVT